MLYSAWIVILLLVYLASIFISHALWDRMSPTGLAPQGRALLVVAGNLLVFAILACLVVIRYGSDLAWIPYIVICLACFGYCYWSLICLSESGRRYRIVFLVDSGQAQTRADLAKLYGREAIVTERVKRLEQWKEVTRRNGSIVCTRGRLYKASLVLYTWARFLGFRWF